MVIVLVVGFLKAITTPTNCAVCQSALKRVTEQVLTGGKIRTVCANCARQFAIERSRLAVAAQRAAEAVAVPMSQAKPAASGRGDVATALWITAAAIVGFAVVTLLVAAMSE